MIKKQYHRHPTSVSYFSNFIRMNDPEGVIEDELKKYNASVGKSKNKNYKLNVKWHDEKLYMMFVLRYQ
jgi:hypothetical protein